ncbi:tyrosine-type recombinase/integrase [Acidithiobacillus sp. HP-6]|nr:tyrosine-type recombinase/integrase [Acidithiobacillus sp. HP-6]MBE7568978.1 tyrosine-type recombinase/integrase [Acidithiobacillus sp. HP-2]
MRAVYNRAVKRAGIEGLTFHDLRHEATSRLCEKGIPIMTVQVITGHKSTQIQRGYWWMRYGGNTLPDMESRAFPRLVRGFG